MQVSVEGESLSVPLYAPLNVKLIDGAPATATEGAASTVPPIRTIPSIAAAAHRSGRRASATTGSVSTVLLAAISLSGLHGHCCRRRGLGGTRRSIDARRLAYVASGTPGDRRPLP